jgi:hypothetical protein
LVRKKTYLLKITRELLCVSEFPILQDLNLEFFIDIILAPYYGPRVDSASNRNEY